MAPDRWVYEPGVAVRCPLPTCQGFVALYGGHIRVSIRRHPLGRKGQRAPAPTQPNGESRPCIVCGMPLDLKLEIIDGTARVA
jgi:hypothetical protein